MLTGLTSYLGRQGDRKKRRKEEKKRKGRKEERKEKTCSCEEGKALFLSEKKLSINILSFSQTRTVAEEGLVLVCIFLPLLILFYSFSRKAEAPSWRRKKEGWDMGWDQGLLLFCWREEKA